MNRLRRVPEPFRAYLITTNTMQRLPLFTDRRLAQVVVDNLAFYRALMGFSLHGYVLMPDHLHALISTPTGDISSIMRNVKSFSAMQIREILGRSGAVWQDRFHDVGIRGRRHFDTALDYIHQNPVKAGLVEAAADYPFSSAAIYLRGVVCTGLVIDLPDGDFSDDDAPAASGVGAGAPTHSKACDRGSGD